MSLLSFGDRDRQLSQKVIGRKDLCSQRDLIE